MPNLLQSQVCQPEVLCRPEVSHQDLTFRRLVYHNLFCQVDQAVAKEQTVSDW